MIDSRRTTPIDIIDTVVSIEWLYEKVFWKLLHDLVYDRAIAQDIHILKNVYKFSNADDIFIAPIDRDEFWKLTKIIFKYQENFQAPINLWK